jgi:hypothetical protein
MAHQEIYESSIYMEQPENTEAIEAAQTEFGQFLVSMMPVPWERIYFYDEGSDGHHLFWFAVKETGVICRLETFWKRYEMPEGNRLDRRNAVYERLFSGWTKDVAGKYPATESCNRADKSHSITHSAERRYCNETAAVFLSGIAAVIIESMISLLYKIDNINLLFKGGQI